jgi:hypothetical protein
MIWLHAICIAFGGIGLLAAIGSIAQGLTP